MRGSWQALDANNTLVPGVRAGTLADALSLIGRGRVVTVFGQLVAGVVVVDVDMARGDLVVAPLVAWCVERDVWHIVRRSGRPGHSHVFIVAGETQPELERLCADLRKIYRVGGSRIQVRSAVRPLSAPHRSGTTPPLPPRLPSAARTLARVLATLPERKPAAPRPVTSMMARQMPTSTPRRDLPSAWAGYLASGVPPAQVAGWGDATRSAVESTATWRMVTAGWTVDEAWLAITQAHPGAMSKARQRGRRWWVACVWNGAVEAATAPPAGSARRAHPDAQLVGRIAGVRAAFLSCWTARYDDPRRHGP